MKSTEENNSSKRLKTLVKDKSQCLESLCRQCGACCGSLEDDPCEHLVRFANGKYFCNIYENRFGMHKTVNGNSFRCVSIFKILKSRWFRQYDCPYKEVAEL